MMFYLLFSCATFVLLSVSILCCSECQMMTEGLRSALTNQRPVSRYRDKRPRASTPGTLSWCGPRSPGSWSPPWTRSAHCTMGRHGWISDLRIQCRDPWHIIHQNCRLIAGNKNLKENVKKVASPWRRTWSKMSLQTDKFIWKLLERYKKKTSKIYTLFATDK